MLPGHTEQASHSMMSSWVSPKIVTKNAGAKGNGSFAISPIQKGEEVIVQGGRILRYQEVEESTYQPFAYHCFPIDRDWLICPVEPKWEKLDGIFQVNHSCEPNCGFRGQIVLVTMRDIAPEEEITYDYAMTDANWQDAIYQETACFCGSATCRRIFSGMDWQRKDLQDKYKGYFSTFVQEMIKKTAS